MGQKHTVNSGNGKHAMHGIMLILAAHVREVLAGRHKRGVLANNPQQCRDSSASEPAGGVSALCCIAPRVLA